MSAMMKLLVVVNTVGVLETLAKLWLEMSIWSLLHLGSKDGEFFPQRCGWSEKSSQRMLGDGDEILSPVPLIKVLPFIIFVNKLFFGLF
jgi:hypothetical protein